MTDEQRKQFAAKAKEEERMMRPIVLRRTKQILWDLHIWKRRTLESDRRY
jgi:hypothetical protein